jgi:phosphotransferase system enzyme I (PtsI)
MLAVKQKILTTDLNVVTPQVKKILRSYDPRAITEAVEQLSEDV